MRDGGGWIGVCLWWFEGLYSRLVLFFFGNYSFGRWLREDDFLYSWKDWRLQFIRRDHCVYTCCIYIYNKLICQLWWRFNYFVFSKIGSCRVNCAVRRSVQTLGVWNIMCSYFKIRYGRGGEGNLKRKWRAQFRFTLRWTKYFSCCRNNYYRFPSILAT